MSNSLEDILSNAQKDIIAVETPQILDETRSKYLGKKGVLTDVMKGLATMSKEERPVFGKRVNEVKQKIDALLNAQSDKLRSVALQESLKKDVVDVTLPGIGLKQGTLHPITQMQNELEHFFANLGFEIIEGPEVEDDYHNFTALNIPENHPARSMHDTFHLEDGNLLRTHTSPMQIRIMENREPPIAAVVPGRVYRCDYDATHSPMFHQFEGFMVDKNITMGDLKWVLHQLVIHFFGADTKFKLRPSYFPFTEPSAELDIWWKKKNGEELWLENGGAGMIHPNVLKAVNIDSKKYSGFAFGLGIDRMAMLKYGIDDLRLLFDNDIRFLKQF